jgi:hypothetical protein
MSKENLRKDKTCLNCSHVVEKRFCANCGQENTQPRKTFHHLFTHFAEDLVHYDGAFWKTVKALLFKPAVLTKEYLSGKRKTYVPPVKLYIFINFLAFFLLSVLPSNSGEEGEQNNKTPKQQEVVRDTISRNPNIILTKPNSKNSLISDFQTVRELDSVQNSKPESEKMPRFAYWLERKLTEVSENTPPDEMKEKFTESFQHNLPKVLFLYMPFFAFVLWLFHGKKRWYYFDHGIFTLHYFSFLLLTFSVILILYSIVSYCGETANNVFLFISFTGLPLWWFFYFFRSHRRFYGESKLVSRLKSCGLFIINFFLIIFFMLGAMLYTALNIH